MRRASKIEVTCLNCDKNFKVKPSEKAKGKGKFCSRECYGKWQSKNLRGENSPVYKRVTIVCEACGKEFKVAPSVVRRGKKYCSKECYIEVQPRKLQQKGLEETLRELYVKKKLSSRKIGKILGCCGETVLYWMCKFGIAPRTRSELFKMNNPAKRLAVRKKMSEKAKLRGQRPEEKKRRSELAKKLWKNPSYRKRVTKGISISLIGNKRRKGIPHSEEVKKKIGKTSKKHWKNPEYVRKVLNALQEKPNKFERKLIRLIKENGFPFKYVGDGQVIIDGNVPDFIATDNSRKIIELFGMPWHDPNHSKKIEVKPNRTEEAKRKFYERHGYKLLVIWGYELKDKANIVEKIRDFSSQHIALYEEVLNSNRA